MTTRSKITLRNNFHNTEATVISLDGFISSRAMRRAENKLCGISDCQCGGTRGQQDVYLVRMSNGDVEAIPLEPKLDTRVIETKMDKLGGFYAADVTNKIIMYAYPTSIHACAAVKSPAKVAESMLSSEAPIAFESRPRWYQDRWDRMRSEMLNA